ncbi:MAG: phasin family protein [Alphaproteobacteria bacterium]|nr:phasin family protein [Alphaproteobacteria bacterium]MBL7100061.1 phasin family protein [Alphaproteobacteria bacterium]
MMAKAKTAGEKINGATETFETAFKNGTETLKANFEKAVKNYDQFLGFQKDTVEAYVKAANVAGKGAETLHNEIYAFSKQSIEDSIAHGKAVMASKSAHEAFELQTGFAKTAFEAYVGELTKLGELFVATSKETFEPIQGRVQAWVEVVQSARAA